LQKAEVGASPLDLLRTNCTAGAARSSDIVFPFIFDFDQNFRAMPIHK
jgi:hypothetical protein